MEATLNINERPEVFIAERRSSELLKLIRKLRWIGMEKEAQRMQIALWRVHPAVAATAGPLGKDGWPMFDLRNGWCGGSWRFLLARRKRQLASTGSD
jgi:hypothetical protein